MGFDIKPLLTAKSNLSHENYRHYTLTFERFSEMRLQNEFQESFRVQISPNATGISAGPIISTFDAKITCDRMYLSDINVEPYTSLQGEQLQLALRCLLYALHKFCKINKIKELAIDHCSTTLNEAARASKWYPRIDRKSGDTTYMLRSICC